MEWSTPKLTIVPVLGVWLISEASEANQLCQNINVNVCVDRMLKKKTPCIAMTALHFEGLSQQRWNFTLLV